MVKAITRKGLYPDGSAYLVEARALKATSDTRVQVIEPPSGLALPALREIAHQRDLLLQLTARDIKVRYKQTTIGAAWAIAQPLVFAAIFSAVLTMFGRVPSGGAPYPVFAFAGLTLWYAASGAFGQVSLSPITAQALISKTYFPRLILPLSALGAPTADFAMAAVVLVTVMLAFGVPLSPGLLLAPLFLAAVLLVAFGAGLWLAALTARYRDVGILVPMLTQVFLLGSPILYPLEAVPEPAQPFYAVNPMVGILEGFRWAVLPDAAAPGLLLLVPIVTGILLVLGGLFAFAQASRTFADTM